MQDKWWKNAVIYEIYCRSFYDSDGDGIGDLEGVIQKLPYLKELGVDCLWFTPIYTSPQVDNGYDVADYRTIDPIFGSNDTFRKLLDKAHGMGMRIIMDMVLNHSSDECEWFRKSRQSKDNPYREFYHWRKPKPNGDPPTNWSNVFHDGNGSAWKYDEQTGESYLHLYAEKMPDLNWESPALRKEVYAMMNDWLKMGVDGFRLDVICRLKKPPEFKDDFTRPVEGTPYYSFTCDYLDGIHDIIRDIRKNTWGKPEYDAFAIGEASGIRFPDDFQKLLDPKNEELDLLYHFLIANRFSKPEKAIPTIRKMHGAWADWLSRGIWPTNHLSTHDQPRQVSKFGSERYRVRSAKALALMNFLLPGTPIVYQGEEIGMTNTFFDTIEEYNDRYTVGEYHTMIKSGRSPEDAMKILRKASRDNARTPVQWDGTENAGFTSGKPWIGINRNYKKVNVAKDLKNKNSVLQFYKSVIAFRREHPAVPDGSMELTEMQSDTVFSFIRRCPEETLLFLINLSSREQAVTLPADIQGKNAVCLLTSLSPATSALSSRNLLPYEAAVFRI